MHVSVDAEKCVASGQCVMLAPSVFDQDDDGTVVLLKEQVEGEEIPGAEQSARVCPAAAIFLAAS